MDPRKADDFTDSDGSDSIEEAHDDMLKNPRQQSTNPSKRRTGVLPIMFAIGTLFAFVFSSPMVSSISRGVHYSGIQSQQSTSHEPVPDIQELKSYLHFAYAAFCPNETLHNWTCPWCTLETEFQMTTVLFNETTQTRGFVGYLPEQNLIVASFRGSQSNANWILDLEPGTALFHNTTVRKGWLVAYQAIQKQLFAALQEIHNKHCPTCNQFVTTGHSLGAAMSGLAALDVKLSIPWITRAGMRNFGMPRVGHQDFVDLFHTHVNSSFRVVHYHDLVPHYPLRFGKDNSLLRRAVPYHHVATELWESTQDFGTGTALKHCFNGNGEDPHCSNSIPPWHWNPDDHMTYLGVVNDNCKSK